MADNSTALNYLSCPSGGFLSVCYESGQSGFIGCCNDDPCGSLGCSDGDLQSTSFNPQYYGKIPDQGCSEAGAKFWTCSLTSPPFWGCCKTNPCGPSACPTGDLDGAVIKQQPGNPFIPTLSSNQSSSSASATSAAASTSAASPAHSSALIGTIIGSVLGGLAVLGVAAIAIFLWSRRRKVIAVQTDDSVNQDSFIKHGDFTTQSSFSPNITSYPGSAELPSGQFSSEDLSMRYSVQSGYSGYTLGSLQINELNHQLSTLQELPVREVVFELPEVRDEERQ